MKILSNLAISLDGKIATRSRVHFPLGTPADRKLMQVLRKRADAILMGASTLRAYRKPLIASGARRQPLNVVVSSRLAEISPSWPFFADARIKRLIFVAHDAPESAVRKFTPRSEVIRLARPSSRNPIARQIAAALERRGIRTLLVEGGGQVMWDFAEPDLIDEYYVTLTPRILGGAEAPTLVDGAGFGPARVLNLKLKSCRRLGDELYLIYTKSRRRGP